MQEESIQVNLDEFFKDHPSIEHPAIDQLPDDHHSGFVAVIGRPNVGKSTLLNRLLGQKIAITSPKPQTTREQLLGILTEPTYQMILLDTPGIHKAKHKLGRYMVAVATETVGSADVVLWLVDSNVPPKAEDRRIAALLQEMHGKRPLPPIVLGLNKTDKARIAARNQPPHLDAYLELLDWLPARPTPLTLSALTGDRIDTLLDTVVQLLPLGPRYYPEDQVTDLQTRFIAAELIREKALRLLQQELPHSIAVVVDEFTQRKKDLTYIAAIIYVERQSQKGIVLGENGSMIKKISQAARPEIEELVGTRVYLELWVKVWEKWRKREGMLKRLGYAIEQ